MLQRSYNARLHRNAVFVTAQVAAVAHLHSQAAQLSQHTTADALRVCTMASGFGFADHVIIMIIIITRQLSSAFMDSAVKFDAKGSLELVSRELLATGRQ
jgi:hypothetical protein